MKIYIDREGGRFTSWYFIGNARKRFESSHDLDLLLQTARKFKISDAPIGSQRFTTAILTDEASYSYYERDNAPKKINLKENSNILKIKKIINEMLSSVKIGDVIKVHIKSKIIPMKVVKFNKNYLTCEYKDQEYTVKEISFEAPDGTRIKRYEGESL